MQEVLASIVARVVDVGGRVHAASEPYDQPRAAGGRERTVRFAAIDGLSAAEESAVGPEQGPEVCIHGSNLARSSPACGTTRRKSVDKSRKFLGQPEGLVGRPIASS